MKRPLSQHEESLHNWRESMRRARVELERMKAALDKGEKDMAFFELQIETAKKERKDSFDDEKYLVRRHKPNGVIASFMTSPTASTVKP